MQGQYESLVEETSTIERVGFSRDPWVRAPTVLVIEDHSALNLLLGIRLRHRGYQVRSAFDGVEGVQRAFQEEPDLILLDLGLPKLSGREVLRALREHPGTFDTPVLVVTGNAEATEIAEAQGWGSIRRVFQKPTPAAQIIEAVESILSQR